MGLKLSAGGSSGVAHEARQGLQVQQGELGQVTVFSAKISL